LGIVGFGLIAVGPATAAQVTYCPQPPNTQYIGPVDAPGDLIVPPNTSCGPTEGSMIGHDAIVSEGASFFPGGTTIGYDVLANRADLIELGDPNNGTTDMIVRHDVIIRGTQGNLPFGQFVCQTRIGHNLVITGTAAGVSQWYIGYQDPSNCGRNYGRGGDTIGNIGFFENNANTIYVGDNNNTFNGGTGLGFRHDLIFIDNHGAINQLSDNTVGYDCRQADNHPFLGFSNTAGNSVDACNTSNP
jgi:hypothetical protein